MVCHCNGTIDPGREIFWLGCSLDVQKERTTYPDYFCRIGSGSHLCPTK